MSQAATSNARVASNTEGYAFETIQSPSSDWILRSADAIPGPRWVLIVISIVATTCISLVYRFATGEHDFAGFGIAMFGKWYVWLDMLNGLIFGFAWAANSYLHHGPLRDLAMLRRSLDLTTAEFDEHVRRIAAGSNTTLFAAGLFGAALLFSMTVFDPGFWTNDRPEFFSFEMAHYGGRQFAIGFLAGTAILREFRATRGLARLGGEHTIIDLLDLRPLQPFAQKGLRSAATWLVSTSLTSLYWLSEATAVAIGPLVSVSLILSLVVFLFPLIPLHRAIVAEKNRQLDRLRETIRAHGEPMASADAQANPQFANLVAYYNLIENTREWPVETTTLLRFAAFAALGLGSWLGAALVEQMLESLVR